ncbi:HAMP domain-containing histidine kinase [Oscillatoriales cyanobacterium LEGE 11467]|uniref:histidine kinase n=1 Tax=Zarconia navalis LEGE 11467 TaxID=1828826 RepID=A0A928VXC2_9CYAN|nr:HAMP domain-containing sensor histidine kinase [Zarconia navalis]MBE9039515.1 HAMP domain-containing histidine kinase [Zarconia navalis LEGE 11467]
MDWSNWIFLGFGLALGIGSQWLGRSSSTSRVEKVSDATVPATDDTSDAENLRSQLEQFRLNDRMLADMIRYKAGFLARVSHELRSPLSGAIGAHQIILADLCNDAEEERDFLSKANESALKMVEMLEEIIKVSRVEEGKLPLKMRQFPVEDIFEEVYGLTYLQATNRNYPFNIEYPDPEIEIYADFKILRQILVHAIETAIFNMEEGSLNFSVQSIPSENRVEIWLDSPCPFQAWSDPVDFLQSEHPSTPESPPRELSIGLSAEIDRSLLERMGGRLEILEAPQEGSGYLTRIQCSLPSSAPVPAVPA